MNHYIISLDLGTDNTSIVAAMYDEHSPYGLKILYQETVQSRGIKRGVICNLNEVRDVVNGLFKRLDPKIMKASAQTKRWYVANVSGVNYRFEQITAKYNAEGHQITQIDINNILKKAQENQLIDKERETLSRCVPMYYSLGPATIMVHPENMAGVSDFEGTFGAIIADNRAINDVNSLLPSKGSARLSNIYSNLSAKAFILLNQQERKQGVLFVDLGGGTTNVAVYCNETLRYEVSLPFGSDTITSDLAMGQEIEFEKASKIKHALGLLGREKYGNQEVDFKIDGEDISCHVGHVDFMMRARAEEIVSYVDSALTKTRCRQYIKSIVLTGGGANLQGIVDLFSERFSMDKSAVSVAQMPIALVDDYLVQLSGAIGLAALFADENKKNFSTEEQQQPTLFDNPQPQPTQPKTDTEKQDSSPVENSKPIEKNKKKNPFVNFLEKVKDTFTDMNDGPSI